MGVCFHSWETFGSRVKKIVLDSKIYNYHCLSSHTCMWKTNMPLCRLTLAWMPPPGQSGASGLPPPPWYSKQSCSEPKTSAPALPWSPPGKHRNLRGCCRGVGIHLFREVGGKQGYCLLSSLYDWSWLIFSIKSRWKVQLSSAGTASPKPCLLADIICHIHSYTFSLKALGLQLSIAFAKCTRLTVTVNFNETAWSRNMCRLDKSSRLIKPYSQSSVLMAPLYFITCYSFYYLYQCISFKDAFGVWWE